MEQADWRQCGNSGFRGWRTGSVWRAWWKMQNSGSCSDGRGALCMCRTIKRWGCRYWTARRSGVQSRPAVPLPWARSGAMPYRALREPSGDSSSHGSLVAGEPPGLVGKKRGTLGAVGLSGGKRIVRTIPAFGGHGVRAVRPAVATMYLRSWALEQTHRVHPPGTHLKVVAGLAEAVRAGVPPVPVGAPTNMVSGALIRAGKRAGNSGRSPSDKGRLSRYHGLYGC